MRVYVFVPLLLCIAAFGGEGLGQSRTGGDEYPRPLLRELITDIDEEGQADAAAEEVDSSPLVPDVSGLIPSKRFELESLTFRLRGPDSAHREVVDPSALSPDESDFIPAPRSEELPRAFQRPALRRGFPDSGHMEMIDPSPRLPTAQRRVEESRTSGEGTPQSSRPLTDAPGSFLPARSGPKGEWTVRLSRNVGERDARDDSVFAGSLAATISRVRLAIGSHLHASFAMAKQRGEAWRDGFLTGSIGYTGRKGVNQLVAGDFTMNAGEGLVLAGTKGRAGNRALRASRGAGGLAPYHGTGSQGYLRGAGLALQCPLSGGMLRGTVFFSQRQLSAAVREDGTVSSFDWTGLVRTAVERSRQGNLSECLIGGRAVAAFPRIRLGATWYRSVFDRTIVPSSGTGFKGDRCEIRGVDAALQLGSLLLFGEYAGTHGGAASGLAGLLLRPAATTAVTLCIRSYGKDFANPHAAAFGEHADGSNEQGMYIAWSVGGKGRVAVDGSIDLRRHALGSASDPLPSQGMSLNLRCIASLDSAVSGVARLRVKRWSETRAIASEPGGEIRSRVDAGRTEISGVFVIRMGQAFFFRSQHAWKTLQFSRGFQGGRGLMMSAGILFRSDAFNAELRCGLFDADRSEVSLYDAEPDAGRSLTSPPLCGRGARYAAGLEWQITRGVRLAGKCGATVLEAGPAAGTGEACGPVLLSLTAAAAVSF